MPTPLLLVDNSRIKLEKQGCERARYLEYASGPTGYGIRLRRQSLPLATGIGVHDGGAKLLTWTLKHGEGRKLPPRAVARELIGQAVFRYYKRCDARGFLNVSDTYTQRTIREQCALIEGLLWGAYRSVFPELLRSYKVIHVEEEGEVLVVGCTCGLGDLMPSYKDHEARDCGGIGWMSRPDIVLQHLADGSVRNCDLKTSGDVTRYNWAEQLNQGLQFMGQVAALKLKGYDVHETLVVGLHKSYRQSATEEDEYGQKRVTSESAQDRKQRSVFCWAYKRPASPPLIPEEWRPTYSWKEVSPRDGTMVTRKCGKEFVLSPVWEARFEGKPADYTAIEYWVEWLPLELVASQFRVVGPFVSPEHKLQAFYSLVKHNGQHWKKLLWELYVVLERNEFQWAREEVQAWLNEHIPQSWNCIQYRSDCQFREICNHADGWEDPLTLMGGKYEPRSPHHEPERQQAKDRGIEIAGDQEEFEEEEE